MRGKQLLVIVTRVLGEFKRPSQHLEKGNCDGYAKAPFRSMRASTVAVARPAAFTRHLIM
jgi:hypothetical protein